MKNEVEIVEDLFWSVFSQISNTEVEAMTARNMLLEQLIYGLEKGEKETVVFIGDDISNRYFVTIKNEVETMTSCVKSVNKIFGFIDWVDEFTIGMRSQYEFICDTATYAVKWRLAHEKAADMIEKLIDDMNVNDETTGNKEGETK